MVESMWKDFECTFGILKGWFHILKTGIRLHSLKAADQIWKTCCALHNWLLETDGLDKFFDQDGTESEWEGPLGQHDVVKFQQFAPGYRLDQLDNMIQDMQNYNASRFGCLLPEDMAPVDEVVDDDSSEFEDSEFIDSMDSSSNSIINDNVHVIWDQDFDFFHSKLVEHFDILYQECRIIWPKHKNANL